MQIISNKTSFLNGLKSAVGNHERRVAERVKQAVYTLHHEITHRTPVWTGQALASYRWSVGNAPDSVVVTLSAPHLGPTNHLPLGPEPNRAEAQAIADESLKALDMRDPYKVFSLQNAAPHIGGLEYGLLPEAPLQQRSPAGMYRLSLDLVAAMLAAKGSAKR